MIRDSTSRLPDSPQVLDAIPAGIMLNLHLCFQRMYMQICLQPSSLKVNPQNML